jgi:hypothetical protein
VKDNNQKKHSSSWWQKQKKTYIIRQIIHKVPYLVVDQTPKIKRSSPSGKHIYHQDRVTVSLGPKRKPTAGTAASTGNHHQSLRSQAVSTPSTLSPACLSAPILYTAALEKEKVRGPSFTVGEIYKNYRTIWSTSMQKGPRNNQSCMSELRKRYAAASVLASLVGIIRGIVVKLLYSYVCMWLRLV